jgi:hypothetical protein
MGGFLARMGLIQNAAFDHVSLFWPFPIEHFCGKREKIFDGNE